MRVAKYFTTRIRSVRSDLSHDQLLEAGAAWWRAHPARVIECDRIVVLDVTDTVVASGVIEGILKNLDDLPGRIKVIAKPDPDFEYIGKKIRRSDSRNPVEYMNTLTVVAE